MRLPDDLLHALVGNDYHFGEFQNDQRGADRLPLRQRAVISVIKDAALGPKTACQVKDVSATGIGMMTVAAIKVGTEFVVWLKDQSQNGLAIECKVMRCAVGKNGSPLYTIGAAFSRMHVPMSPEERRRQMEVEQIRAAILD